MILRSSRREAGCTVAKDVSLGRDSNRDPVRYRANLIHFENNIRSNENINNEVATYGLGDGSLCKIFRCGAKRCQFQHKFSPQDRVLSTATKRVYNCIVPPGSTYINGHSSNVVYLITCDKCKLQYVGETCQNLNKRFNWHSSCFKNPSKYSFCKILNSHFDKSYCKGSSYTVKNMRS